MNERIKELAEQAGLKQGEWSGHPPVWMETLDSPGGLEKFAELLIKECAEICRRQQYYDADDEFKRGSNGGSFTCMNAIKRHFGVE